MNRVTVLEEPVAYITREALECLKNNKQASVRVWARKFNHPDVQDIPLYIKKDIT